MSFLDEDHPLDADAAKDPYDGIADLPIRDPRHADVAEIVGNEDWGDFVTDLADATGVDTARSTARGHPRPLRRPRLPRERRPPKGL